jgi:hypothetical protein
LIVTDSCANTNSLNSKILEERIGPLTEEVEIATNVKLNLLYIADRKDEIEFVRWTVIIIDSILNRENKHKRVQLGTTKCGYN